MVSEEERVGMNDYDAIGPIDYVLLEFPDQAPSGEPAAALADLIEAGVINLYDIVAIRKDADGNVSGFEIADLGDGTTGFAAFAGARSGLLGEDDVDEAASAMEPGTIAVLLIYENAWAAPFVAAAARAGGQMIASARIPAGDIMAMLDELEQQD